jgi:hypothetical protein
MVLFQIKLGSVTQIRGNGSTYSVRHVRETRVGVRMWRRRPGIDRATSLQIKAISQSNGALSDKVRFGYTNTKQRVDILGATRARRPGIDRATSLQIKAISQSNGALSDKVRFGYTNTKQRVDILGATRARNARRRAHVAPMRCGRDARQPPPMRCQGGVHVCINSREMGRQISVKSFAGSAVPSSLIACVRCVSSAASARRDAPMTPWRRVARRRPSARRRNCRVPCVHTGQPHWSDGNEGVCENAQRAAANGRRARVAPSVREQRHGGGDVRWLAASWHWRTVAAEARVRCVEWRSSDLRCLKLFTD